MMTLVICPGIHEPRFTQEFLQAMQQEIPELAPYYLFPTEQFPAVSAWHLRYFLEQQCQLGKGARPYPSLTFLCFSAGVVAGIIVASWWQANRGSVRAFIALDGWGMPLMGDFPIFRVSHDYFTHWSSSWLGSGQERFYAEPAVEHLALWRLPHQVTGWHIQRNAQGQEEHASTTASAFLARLIRRYEKLGAG